jgi:uncharacterized protein YutE (UPF0331/DUF86 family)
MVDRNVVAAKLIQLAQRLERIRQRTPASAAELAADADRMDLIAFNLMLAVQSCLDIASHIISDEGWIPPLTLGEAFVRLGEHGVIAPQAAAALKDAAGLRNVIAHGYVGVNTSMLYKAATTGVSDLDAFARQVSAWLQPR